MPAFFSSSLLIRITIDDEELKGNDSMSPSRSSSSVGWEGRPLGSNGSVAPFLHQLIDRLDGGGAKSRSQSASNTHAMWRRVAGAECAMPAFMVSGFLRPWSTGRPCNPVGWR
jgi:hypothetical protein